MKLDAKWAWEAFEPNGKTAWNRRAAAHLFRRAGFSATHEELTAAVARSPREVVRDCIRGRTNKSYESEVETLTTGLRASGSRENLPAWWLYQMAHSPDPMLEKLTLFWHGHFATSAAKVDNVRQMLDQHQILRQHARGKFLDLAQGISRDPAMLIYLDSTTNRKVRPNENYARELMELFCLGLGNYTEQDIQQAARAFTGWEVRGGKFRFNAVQHDEGSKTIFKLSGNFNGDDVVKLVVQQPAASRFIAGKLVRYFVADEPEPSAELIEPLAKDLRENDFDIGRVVERILGSNLFFSPYALGRKVRSPVELAVGLVRALGAKTNYVELGQDLDKLGQSVFFPPNVKGWDGGRTWINSSTMIGRANLVGRLSRGGMTIDGGLASRAQKAGASSADEVVEWLADLFLAAPLPDEARRSLAAIIGSPKDNRNESIARALHALGAMPEFQLA